MPRWERLSVSTHGSWIYKGNLYSTHTLCLYPYLPFFTKRPVMSVPSGGSSGTSVPSTDWHCGYPIDIPYSQEIVISNATLNDVRVNGTRQDGGFFDVILSPRAVSAPLCAQRANAFITRLRLYLLSGPSQTSLLDNTFSLDPSTSMVPSNVKRVRFSIDIESDHTVVVSRYNLA